MFLSFSGTCFSPRVVKAPKDGQCEQFAAVVLEAAVFSNGHLWQEFSVPYLYWIPGCFSIGSPFFAKVRCCASADWKYFSLLSGKPCFLSFPGCLPIHLTSNFRKKDILLRHFWNMPRSCYQEPICLILGLFFFSLFRLSIKNLGVKILPTVYENLLALFLRL